MVDQYDMVRPWQAKDKERDLYPHPINTATRVLLRNVALIKYYEKDKSLKAHSVLFPHLIHSWSFEEQGFHVSLEAWYMPFQEEIYFVTRLSRGGEDFLQFPDVPHGFSVEIHLAYSQRYVRPHVFHPTYFQVRDGQLQISSFAPQEVRCLSLLVTTIAHFSSDGKNISFPLLSYLYPQIQEP